MAFLATERVDLPATDISSWIFDRCSYDHNKPILIDAVDPSRSISFDQARQLVRQLVAGFHASGLQPGDCVCIHSFNDVYYPILVMGIYAAGGIFAGTNPAYTQYELCHHIKTAQVKFLISEPELLGPLLEAASETKIAPEKIWVFHPLASQKCPPGQTSWKQLFTHGSKDWIRFDTHEEASRTIAMRLFSSGTTGLPKATSVSHLNLIAQHELAFLHNRTKTYDEEKHIYPLPMFHAAVAPRLHSAVFKDGFSTYILRRFDLEQFLSSIQKYQVTELTVVPPMAIAIIMSPLNQKYSLKSIRTAVAGAAPLPKETQARLKQLLGPDTPCTQVWGMTETSCVATKFPWPEDDATGAVGRPIPNLDIKLVDDSGTDITAYDTRGEICVRGPTVVPGYFNDPTANQLSFDRDNFFHTGDIGYCDAASKLWYIVDRKKELIKVRGFQVAPPEIEGLLLQHPGIVDVAVIGVPAADPRDGEVPRAYVVRRPGSADAAALDEKGVRAYVEPKLAGFKRLVGGVRFVEAIPKNASGKILKRILREEAKKEGAGSGARL